VAVRVIEEPNMPDRTMDDVRRVIDTFADCWNRHDMAAFAALFAADAEFVNVVGMWWRGRAEIQAAHEFTHSNLFKDSRLSVLETRVRLPAEDVALARARWRLEAHVGPDGSALAPRNGLLFGVLQYKAGAWLIIDMQNTDIIEGVVSRPQ
jgi:uncharacterized protein (TIGR02246 family)